MSRRPEYYGSAVPAAPMMAMAAIAGEPEPVQGAKAIAEALKLDPVKGPRQVFRLVEAHRDSADPPPIENVPGLGLVADKAALLSWWRRRLGQRA